MIERIWAVSFSPTGNTEKLVTAAAAAAAGALGKMEQGQNRDGLCSVAVVKAVNIADPAVRAESLVFGQGDLVFLAVPTYAGRVPNKLMPYIRDRISGSGAFGAAMVTFGGRSFDDALAELSDLMEGNGFRLLGGGAFVCRHAFAEVAVTRPDERDRKQAEALGAAVTGNLQAAKILPAAAFPGNHPAGPYYIPKRTDGQPAVFLKARPKLRKEQCSGCGRCAGVCPMGSIDAASKEVTGICIKCQACVTGCPEKARYFDDPDFLSHKAMLEAHFSALGRESEIVV